MAVIIVPAERFGVSAIGADIGTTARRPATAEAAYQDGDRDQERRQMALAMKVATEAGKFDENGTAKAAHDNAAMIQPLVRDKRFDTVEDTLSRRVDSRSVAGATWWTRR